jgi:DNA-directed RNA polymerase specialized sigma subunit
MTNDSIPHKLDKQKLLNELSSKIASAYSEDVKRLIYLCYDNDISQQEIADALGVARSNISMQYPKKGKSGK